MTEPKVEFDIARLNDDFIKEQFDQLRRWHEYREDRRAPAMQTFQGELDIGGEVLLNIPGKVYGYSGMTTNGGTKYWQPMVFSLAVPGAFCYFALELDNVEGSFVKIRNGSTADSHSYRATVFYRDE